MYIFPGESQGEPVLVHMPSIPQSSSVLHNDQLKFGLQSLTKIRIWKPEMKVTKYLITIFKGLYYTGAPVSPKSGK